MGNGISIEQRFWGKVEWSEGCWKWLPPPKREGYGQFWHSTARGMAYAHRVAYELAVGPIPTGLVIDHLCRNRRCVNPAHLEPVTFDENVRRGDAPYVNAAKTVCKLNHPLDRVNVTSGKRFCSICAARHYRDARDRRRVAHA